MEHVDSEKNIADIGTKAIFGQDFVYKRQGLLGLQDGEVAVQPLKRTKKVAFNDVVDWMDWPVDLRSKKLFWVNAVL